MKNAKVWGSTKSLIVTPFCELHRIEIDRGGICSKHKHLAKTNFFYVEEGILIIRVWTDGFELPDETILHEGEYTEVKPGVFHQFEAMNKVIAYELYYPTEISHDIVRETQGYMKEHNDEIDKND